MKKVDDDGYTKDDDEIDKNWEKWLKKNFYKEDGYNKQQQRDENNYWLKKGEWGEVPFDEITNKFCSGGVARRPPKPDRLSASLRAHLH